jgi:hypothetical protein
LLLVVVVVVVVASSSRAGARGAMVGCLFEVGNRVGVARIDQ